MVVVLGFIYFHKFELSITKKVEVKMPKQAQELQFCATKVERQTLKKLRDIAFEKRLYLKDLLKEILTDYANKYGVNA